MKFEFLEIPIRSEICLTPGQCYPVQTFIPGYVTLILLGSVFLLIKNFTGK